MSVSQQPPFRADHVGSLLRPAEVRQAREAYQAGRITDGQLRMIEDAAIRRLVKQQEDIGIQGVTDGEIRRTSWHMDFFYQIAGVGKLSQQVRVPFHRGEENLEFTADAVGINDKVRLTKTIFGEDFAFLKSVATIAAPKLTIPSPSVLHGTMTRVSGPSAYDKVYPHGDELIADLAAAYRDEIARLAAMGCSYLQLDDTTFAGLCDPAGRAAYAKGGGDADTRHLTYIDLVNRSLRDRPPGMRICTHTCRGNYRSAWFASGAYDFVAEPLFSQLAVDGFFLEYDDARSGGFEPLRFVPKGKMVVLGLVTTKRPELESKDMLKRRIDEAAKYIPLGQLCLSPQCGFSSTHEGNVLTEEQQMAKLRLVVETAQEVWG
jgi:5-methyltetrahydropteroyltriglutamate--homocysteine methyltransferase